MDETLADVLGEYMQRAHTSANRLATLSKVPAQTIKNWLNRRVTKPHRWQGLVKVAAALHLSESETSRLLQAGGHPALPTLRARAAATRDADRALLASFQSPTANIQHPFQAIADLPNFIGRDSQLAELKHILLDGGQAVVCGLRGMGGVGKTSLAARLAHHLRTGFPDGVLWARLDTSDTLSILGAFADAFGKDVSQHRDVESRAGVVRSLLADKRALIVLDNAETSAQVRPLLPPSPGSCAVLVTTRHDLSALDGWTRFTLDPFPPESDESLKLFEQYLGRGDVARHKDSLMEIADLLGHLPLAIAIAAGRLAATGVAADSIPGLLARLRRAGSRLGELVREDRSVRLSFDVTYEALSPEQQTFFAALGVFGGDDFSAEAAAYVTASTLETAETALKALCGLSLTQESRAGRCRLHPLLRDYAREKLSLHAAPLGGSNAYVRMIEYYFQMVIGVADQGFSPLRSDVSNILFALEAAHSQNNPALLVRCANVFQPMLYYWGLHRELDVLMSRALSAAAQLDDKAELPSLLFNLAMVEAENGTDYAQAEAHCLQALESARELCQWDIAARCLNYLASLASYQGDQGRTEDYWTKAEALARQHGVRRVLATVAHNRGIRAMELGEFAQAESAFEAFVEFCRAEHHSGWLAVGLDNLGTLAYRRGEHEQAERYYAESLAVTEAMDGIRHFPVLLNRGINALSWGKPAVAEALIQEALALARQHGHPRGLSEALRGAGDVAKALGQAELAYQYWQEGLQIVETIGLKIYISDLSRRLGEWHTEHAQLETAETFLTDAYRKARELNNESLLAFALCGRARLAAARGQFAKAKRLASESIALFDAIRDWHAAEVRAALAGLVERQ
jgi:tetratricopeptide (TPR) repeat protein